MKSATQSPPRHLARPRVESWVPREAGLEAIEREDYSGAIDILMREHGDAIFRYCRRMVGEPDLAGEVLQTTFIQAFKALPGFAGRSSLKTWLFGIARHRCLDAVKVERRRQRRFDSTEEIPERPDPTSNAEDSLTSGVLLRTLEDCLGRLAPHVREALVLRYQADLSYPEMAATLKARPPTLQARVARALPVLKQCIEANGGMP